jgi:predicted TIM-barrel fold metal-dependent hydrolase
MIIDGHAHAAREYSSAESILDLAKRYHLDKVVLCTSPKNNVELRDPPSVPFTHSPNSIFFLNRMLRLTYRWAMKDKGDGNRFVSELRSRIPTMVVQFLWVNPLDRHQMDNIEQDIREYQVRGIKLHQAWNPFSIDGAGFRSVVDVARSHGLPVFIHLYSQSQTRKLLQFVGEHQDTVFIIGHLLGMSIFMEQRALLKNVYFDTSGSERIRGRDIAEAIDSFGYDHVVYGSDSPFARLGDQIDKIQQLNLSDNVKEHVFGLNMKNLLSLAS